MVPRGERSVTPWLRVRDVGWRIGSAQILQGVSFDAAPGELIALMGRNGAGKSTLLDLIAGMSAPSHGEVTLGNRPLHQWSPAERARAIGHLPQAVHGDAPFTSEQLVLMGRYPFADQWFESDADRAAVARAMARCGCEHFRARRVATLSGGERQRVLLAACLTQDARLLLMDEPATFLDVDQQLHCFTLLREEAARGVTCIAVTHDINLALTFCSRVIVLAHGTIAHDAQTRDALEHPEWLELFSSRLQLTTTPAGGAWVCYR
jgi:ABC-type cobalamin/Fe3+-siderophores transport system ATPase subunit